MATPAHHAPAPTEAQLQHAFAQLRAAGWPATLAELRLDTTPLATARLGIVLGAARNLACGGHLQRADLAGPITRHITRAPAKRAPMPLPARRHGDAGQDLKRAAAGDSDDDA